MHPLSQETDLNFGIKATSYFFNENTKKLFPKSSFTKDPFREDGSDLAICLHGIQDSSQIISLLSSIEYYLPDFKGQIIITTDASNPGQKRTVEEYVATSTVPVQILEEKEKATIAELRNQAAKNLTSNWLMFIEPGMFFIKNPLQAIKDTIENLGVTFINLPLVNRDNRTIYSLGGALLTDLHKDNLFLGGGSTFDGKPGFEFTDVHIERPFLSDYLYSNACVVNRKAFLQEGGFSSSVTPGLEDVEFSLRLYKKAIKIGNANEFMLVSNKSAEDNTPNTLSKLKIVNGIADKKIDDITYSGTVERMLKFKRSKKRVALIVDIQDWAFHNIAKNIEANLGDKYDFTIYFQADFMGEKWLDIFAVLYKEKFDMVMCFWRPIYKQLFSLENKNYLQYKHKISEEEFEKFLNDTILLTGVYDHLFLKPAEVKTNLDIFSNNVDGYFVSSYKLKDIYEHLDGYSKPYCVIQDGVDPEKYFRKPGTGFSDPASPLIVGWAGNSKWGMNEDGIDHKGFDTIIKPAVAELLAEGYNIKLIYADRHEQKTHVPRALMNDFYNKLDVYICASDIEGTPNPVLESMAVGIGIISTDVGIVKEVLGKEQHKYILEERTKDCLKNKLITLINDRSILNTLASENRVRINTWTWKSKCEKFEQFFDYYFYKKSTKNLRYKKFPFTTYAMPSAEIKPVTTEKENIISPSTTVEQVVINNVIHSDAGAQEELAFWKQNVTETKNWYYKEYEVLPLWFKRLGHIVKVLQGHRKLKSLFSNKS
jgi:glycosyltransferase involved in cell wall biosynthesis